MLCSLKENLQVNLKYKTTKLFISSECTFINKRSTANIKIINYKYTYKFTCSTEPVQMRNIAVNCCALTSLLMLNL